MPNQLRFLYTFLSWYIYRHRAPPNKSRDSHKRIAHVTIGLFGASQQGTPRNFCLLRQVCRPTRKPKFRATPPQIGIIRKSDILASVNNNKKHIIDGLFNFPQSFTRIITNSPGTTSMTDRFYKIFSPILHNMLCQHL
jgi:hypothetical protein